MFPLHHFLLLLNALLCMVASEQLFQSYTKTKNRGVLKFCAAFFILGLYYCFVALPGVFTDPETVRISYGVAYFFLLMAPVVFLWAILEMVQVRWPNLVFIAMGIVTGILVTILLRESEPAPLRTLEVSGIILFHWGEEASNWIIYTITILTGSIAAACSVALFWQGIQTSLFWVRKRAFLIGGGIMVLVLSAILNYVIEGGLNSSIAFIKTISSSLISLAGITLMVAGIFTKAPEEEKIPIEKKDALQ